MMKRFLFIVFFISAFVYGQKEFGKITLPLGRVQVQQGGTGDFKKSYAKNAYQRKGYS